MVNNGPICKDVAVCLTMVDGNAFAIMGTVSKAMKRAKVPQETIDAYMKEAKSGDYDNLLQTTMRYVEVN